ncbi:hypothetical protein TESG_00759 [Trichophyton tonsurans CBS 112818]|uniref:Uncharacterized protein n=1 Tax=Trichophyton tonsurans (strain CBS 112818) TaxID=647933 RepID=F2RPF4_TRIT1|nr:hypothetical protein TESG_00759 [Trichophyton tonsurans CBS 112818]
MGEQVLRATLAGEYLRSSALAAGKGKKARMMNNLVREAFSGTYGDGHGACMGLEGVGGLQDKTRTPARQEIRRQDGEEDDDDDDDDEEEEDEEEEEFEDNQVMLSCPMG